MELREIEQLLDKYFDAETSIAEENQLKEYFSSPGVAPHLEQYRPMFGYFAQEATPQFTKTLPLKTKRHYSGWISVAASLVLLMGMFAYFTNQQSQNDLGTYDDPEIAFRETQKALNMVSKNVNVGINSVNYVGGEYEKSRKTIFKE
ncbi:hypothetical protein GR160_03455 [Flavobacterium sp. Sd200]|uniref:hypothetical protein n=1 Tax=Flavobacterium sp. Sd200 TaxID=2692211 RepID=UPI0013716C7F|nr:hypothetical protein [Flavobacterium sp. Sd200]MXN90272.1 hypothetical protein [Flavobacterium sp. Sd200]